MFGLLMRKVLNKSSINLLINSKRFGPKYLRELQLKKELKLNSIRSTIFDKNTETNGNIDWNQLINDMIEKRLLFKQNFEVELMLAFNSDNDYDRSQVDKNLFQSLMNFLRLVPNVRTNSIAASHYCQFVSEFSQYIDESTVEYIRQTTDQLMGKYSESKVPFNLVLDSINALAKSSKDNCLYAINLLPKIDLKNDQFINSLINSSLKFKLFDQSFQLINTYSDIQFSTECVSNTVNAVLESNSGSEQTIQLLKTFSKALVVFDSTLDSKLIQIMERLGFKSMKTHIQQNGFCLNCGQTLKGISIEEYKTLRNEMRSVIFNKEENLLFSSLPEYEQELNNFEKFMRKLTAKKPLDLVIDGLNIGYSISGQYIPDHKKLRSFVKVYKKESVDEQTVGVLLKNNILENYENILIIGRHHMKGWKKLNDLLFSERNRISCFYAMNQTKDDTYVLYSAVQNPITRIISNDFYRDYFDKMAKKNLSSLFQRWLRTHQILVENKFMIQMPDEYDYKIHLLADNSIIHLPIGYHDIDRNIEINWICCQKQ